MRIALLQVNPTIGDLDGNVSRLSAALSRVRGDVDLVVTPEMALTGYPPRDLLLQPGFIEQTERALAGLARQVADGPVCVVGAPRPAARPAGRPLINAAVVLAGGAVAATHAKSLLPTYDVFDEDRYFEPGEGLDTIDVGEARVALSICEDVWNDADLWPQRRYARDPMTALGAAGARIVVNMSASPYALGKPAERERLLSHLARKYGTWTVYVNQVGGNDDLVFDGRSVAFDPDGRCVGQARAFAEDLLIVDTAAASPVAVASAGIVDEADLFAALVLGVRDYARKTGFTSALLGLSGGIDSAVTAVVAAEALGAEHVRGVLMPSPYSSQGSVDDAAALAASLGMASDTVPIAPMMRAYDEALRAPFGETPTGLTEENLQARIRGAVLMAMSNRTGALLLTTGNKSELATGYCTLYGDMCGALAVLADLYKTQVYALARWINRDREVIPSSSITKPPSAELRPDQTDQDSLPPYDLLDRLLARHIEGHADQAQLVAEGFDPAVVRQVLHLVRVSEFKRRQAAPALKVSSRAFGTGWRMPIARGRWI
jgi:NAD+ synthase/NAD+ synthase (glutamine-hydrolysing)